MDYPGHPETEDSPYVFVRLIINNTLHLDQVKAIGAVIKVPQVRAKYLLENEIGKLCAGPEYDPPVVADDPATKSGKSK